MVQSLPSTTQGLYCVSKARVDVYSRAVYRIIDLPFLYIRLCYFWQSEGGAIIILISSSLQLEHNNYDTLMSYLI